MAESSVLNDVKKVLAEAKFLACGKTGVGKSSLIESLIGPGAEICDVFRHDDLERNINIWSSSGLQDGTVQEESAYLGKMYERCSNVDIVLYCMDINYLSWTTAEVKATELLTQKFGVNFWEKAILVLTKANRVMVPETYRGKETKAIYHKQLYENFVQKFRDQLIQQGVPAGVAANLRAVAAGYCDETEEGDQCVYYVSDKIGNENEKFDFLVELSATCLEIFKNVPRKVFSDSRSKLTPDQRSKLQSIINLQKGLDFIIQNTAADSESIPQSIKVGLGGIGGATAGAIAGTMIAGPIGTLVGGAAGFFVGGFFFL